MAKVLIVDDERAICEEFGDLLKDDGHTIETAMTGMEAIRLVRENDYDIVFLDVLMPRMEGRQIFDEMIKIKKIPVVFMSGYLPPHQEKEVLRLGAVACLKKPIDLKKVKELIRSVKS